jgi:hypothetical protein
MSGPELAAIRRALCGTDTAAFGRAIGYQGKDTSVSVSVRRLETMDRVPEWFAKLASIYVARPRLMTKVPLRNL